jgi:hypothetical protein
MKVEHALHALKSVPLLPLALFLIFGLPSGSAEPADDTIVYHSSGKKRVHLPECRRYQQLTDTEKAAMTKMTYAEAKAKNLPLCSRCPGSTTEGKGTPIPEAEKKPESAPTPAPPTDSTPTTEATPAGEPPGDTAVYWEGKRRVHLPDCVRYQRLTDEEKAAMTKMTYAEAKAKGLPLCSRCPGSTTDKATAPATPATPAIQSYR